MSVIRPKPREMDLPQCERYDDERTVQAFEREMRVYRAHTEPMCLERFDDRVDTTWFVSGSSGSEYAVDIVDGRLYDTCACPDFLSSDLGTCKHLEVVRRVIAARPKLKRELSRIESHDPFPTVSVNTLRAPSLISSGTFSLKQLRALGLDLGPAKVLMVTHPEMMTPGTQAQGTRVTHAAARLAKNLHERKVLAARRREVFSAIDDGRLGLDVLSSKLFEYQRAGVRFLVGTGRALLADDMGLGKTVQALAACELLRLRGEASRILVVTSATLKDQWSREITRLTQSRAVVVSGGAASRRVALESDAPYKILNYEITWRELSTLQNLDADVLILDEAQRAKNFRTRTAMTLRAVPSRFLFVLTGTPIENRLDDLYSLLQLTDPEVLGPLWRFNLRFHQQGARGRVEGYKNLSQLRDLTSSVVLRRRKEEVLTQLPALTEQTRYIALTETQSQLERGYRSDAAQILAIAERRPLRLEEQQRLMACLLKARQACNAARLCDPGRQELGSPKLDEFESLVSEIVAQGTSKVLVFSEWVEMLKMAAARLDAQGIGYAMLHGGIATERRPALLERFRESPEVRVLLSTDAGGTGLNLQVASYVIHLDLPWNPGRLDQRTSRSHRLGQSRGVSVTYLCAETGIERGIEGTLAGKRAIRTAALDLSSDVDTLVAPSFLMFVREMNAALRALEPDAQEPLAQPSETTQTPEEKTPEEKTPEEKTPEEKTPEETTPEETTPEETTPEVLPELSPKAPSESPPEPRKLPGRAGDRLRLAQVLLGAGFPADAVRAAYDALAITLGSLLTKPAPPGHSALVAAIYRELIPGGKLPGASHAVLAKLHDLCSLDVHGIEVDEALARDTVTEATMWIERIAG